ncbi:small integral membrane protein 11 [Ctenodactylus gundi]
MIPQLGTESKGKLVCAGGGKIPETTWCGQLVQSHKGERFLSRNSMKLSTKVLDHVPLLLYILAAKTLIFCLAFAGVKMYQRKTLEAKRQQLEAERKRLSGKKED